MGAVPWLIAILIPLSALAQDGEGGDVGFRFQPPKPPPLDTATDFDDLEDEEMVEVGDEGFRPPTPPQNNSFQPPPPDFRPPPARANGGRGSGLSGKVRFELIEGEFYERGKKRGRGQKLRSSGGGAD